MLDVFDPETAALEPRADLDRAAVDDMWEVAMHPDVAALENARVFNPRGTAIDTMPRRPPGMRTRRISARTSGIAASGNSSSVNERYTASNDESA